MMVCQVGAIGVKIPLDMALFYPWQNGCHLGLLQGGSALQAAPGMSEEADPGGGDGKGIKRKLDLDDC